MRTTYYCSAGLASKHAPLIRRPRDEAVLFAGREYRYLILQRLEAARQLMSKRSAHSAVLSPGARLTYRRVLTELVRELLPLIQTSVKNGSPSLLGEDGRYWLDVSRRVYEIDLTRHQLPAIDLDRQLTVICHVLTPLSSAPAERLIAEFAKQISYTGPVSLVDRRNDLELWGQPSYEIGHRWYWEVVVAPPSSLEGQGLSRPRFFRGVGTPFGANPLQTRHPRYPHDLLTVGMEAETMEGFHLDPDWGDESLADSEARSAYDQASEDWALVDDEIRAAGEVGRALNDEFVAEVAARRLSHALESSSYPSGVTLESSERIVRDLMRLQGLFHEYEGHAGG